MVDESMIAPAPALSDATGGAVAQQFVQLPTWTGPTPRDRAVAAKYKEKMRKRKNSRRIQKAKKASRVRGAQEPLSAAGLGSAKHNEREQQTEQSVENIGMGVEAV